VSGHKQPQQVQTLAQAQQPLSSLRASHPNGHEPT
jgi:hypothetical protein